MSLDLHAIRFDVVWSWTCHDCPYDDGVPTAYGVGDTEEEVQLEATLHLRDVHQRTHLRAVT